MKNLAPYHGPQQLIYRGLSLCYRRARKQNQQRAMGTAHTHAIARRWAVWMEIRRPTLMTTEDCT